MKRLLIISITITVLITLPALIGCGSGQQEDAGSLSASGASDQTAQELEVAVLGGGCFWSMEASFSQLKGIQDVEVGYAGGYKEDPTYEEVYSEETGHAEVVKISFDPEVISYSTLLEVFFYVHDPTTLNRQGFDIGESYRSIILYTSPEQEKTAREYIEMLEEQKVFSDPIVTQVEPLDKYYRAEDYHQEYYENHPGQPYCLTVVGPKVEKFEEKFADLLE